MSPPVVKVPKNLTDFPRPVGTFPIGGFKPQDDERPVFRERKPREGA